MQYRILGKTGLEVSQVALGGLFVSSVGGAFEQGRAAVHRALELGINYVDTAPSYANSEEVLGRALEGVAQPYILSTKLGGRPEPFAPRDINCLRASVEESLRLLKRDRIDLLMVHEPDRPGQYDWWGDGSGYDGPVMDLLQELKENGTIGYTGIGGTTAYEIVPIMQSGHFDVVLTAFNYSLLWREAEHQVLPVAKELGMGVVVGSPLQQGALAQVYDDEVRHGAPWLSLPRRRQFLALYEFVAQTGMSLPELAMRFVVSNTDISCVLSGVRSVAEIEANVAAVERGALPDDIRARLDEIAAMVPFRPFEEPFGLPFGRGGRVLGRAGR
ncbi:MAG: aldo/keto reductase [Candidatus Latescibacteria bacterium]|nr:aldo/keto reductase [Candidatus Latescibacterota bacterium]